MSEINLVLKVIFSVNNILRERNPSLLEDLDAHIYVGCSHKHIMVNKIVSCYVVIKLRHYCKERLKDIFINMCADLSRKVSYFSINVTYWILT